MTCGQIVLVSFVLAVIGTIIAVPIMLVVY